jgi:hypothetical protein
MKKHEKFICEKCDLEFDIEIDCQEHEEHCGKSNIIKCSKCGNEEDIADDEHGWKSEGWYHIDLGRPGYGSGLDGSDVEFTLCDDCLIGFIQTFTPEGQEKVFNSGCNTYLSSLDWIRVHKNEMPDEEMEEKGLYSPRQIKAYEERFPTCDKVYINEYNEGSRGSRCDMGAFGDGEGNSDINVCDECFSCSSYNKREEGKEIPIKYKY